MSQFRDLIDTNTVRKRGRSIYLCIAPGSSASTNDFRVWLLAGACHVPDQWIQTGIRMVLARGNDIVPRGRMRSQPHQIKF